MKKRAPAGATTPAMNGVYKLREGSECRSMSQITLGKVPMHR